MTREALRNSSTAWRSPDEAKARLKALAPATYTGMAEALAKRV